MSISTTERHEQAEPGNSDPDLARWENDGGRVAAADEASTPTCEVMPYEHDVDAAHNMAKNARENAAAGLGRPSVLSPAEPSSAEKQRIVGEAMDEIQTSSNAAYRAVDAIDVATAKMLGRVVNVDSLDTAAALVKEARGKLLTAERMVRAFALSE